MYPGLPSRYAFSSSVLCPKLVSMYLKMNYFRVEMYYIASTIGLLSSVRSIKTVPDNVEHLTNFFLWSL